MTSGWFHQLAGMLLEAAHYLADKDVTAAATLCETRALAVALGEREAASHREARLELELPGLGPR